MRLRSLAAVVAASIAFAGTADAAIVISFEETGGNVVGNYTGSIDLDALGALQGNAPGFDGLAPSAGAVAFTGGNTDFYAISAAQWTPFGAGAFEGWNASSGDALALFTDPVLGLPTGYTSGSPISGTATIVGATFASLGIAPGTYVTTLTNITTDTVTITAAGISATVPLPASLVFSLIGLAGLGAVAGRKNSAAENASDPS